MFSNLSARLDLLGDGDAVLGDPRRAERLIEGDIAALRTRRHLDGVGQGINTPEHARACVGAVLDDLGSYFLFPLLSVLCVMLPGFSTTPGSSEPWMIVSCSQSLRVSVPGTCQQHSIVD
jgi:hypothetical protein